MAVREEEIVRTEIIRYEGKHPFNATVYFYLCRKCKSECHSNWGDLKNRTGLCRPCSNLISSATAREVNKIRPYEALYNNFVWKQNKNGKKIDLSYEDFYTLTEQNSCEYCGSTVRWSEHGLNKNGSQYYLDRKNNDLGYLKSNVVVCCPACNSIKSNKLTYEEMKVAMTAVLEYRKSQQ